MTKELKRWTDKMETDAWNAKGLSDRVGGLVGRLVLWILGHALVLDVGQVAVGRGLVGDGLRPSVGQQRPVDAGARRAVAGRVVAVVVDAVRVVLDGVAEGERHRHLRRRRNAKFRNRK